MQSGRRLAGIDQTWILSALYPPLKYRLAAISSNDESLFLTTTYKKESAMINFTKRYFDKRTETRYVASDNVEVKVLFSSENPSLLGKTLTTTAIEMSQKALRLEVGYPIEIDSVLDIVVTVRGIEKDYYLTGNVRYRLPSSSGHYHIVLVLRERTDVTSDLKAWKAQFENNFVFDKVG